MGFIPTIQQLFQFQEEDLPLKEDADEGGASSDNEDGRVSPGDQGDGVSPSRQASGASLDEGNSRSASDGASFWDGDL